MVLGPLVLGNGFLKIYAALKKGNQKHAPQHGPVERQLPRRQNGKAVQKNPDGLLGKIIWVASQGKEA